jgi:hypothetical protein
MEQVLTVSDSNDYGAEFICPDQGRNVFKRA